MRLLALKYTVLTWVSTLSMAILLLIPFHAFLTVWGSSLVGHYTALRLWKEALLVICIIGVSYLLAADHKIRSHTLTRRLVWVILAYAALNLAWGLLALNQHDVTAKALGYGLISNLRYLAFFLVTWAAALRLGRLRANWRWLVFWPAAAVALFAVAQALILPHDFLTHFGYGSQTIPAYETINHNSHYLRVASFLRGANPLGAYLLIPISLVTMLMFTEKRNWRHVVVLLACLAALFFSFSRSAWAGAAISVAVMLGQVALSAVRRRLLMIVVAGLVVLIAGLAFGLRHNSRFENIVFHTETRSSIKVSSNQNHAAAIRAGLNDLRHHPLGNGPGTAGPASFYNHGQPRIAENYFIQVGQETGWLGLALFLLINAGVGYLLWSRRADPLALSLFASFIGLTFVNLLSHAWADDTLAYLWWGLAGIAMAPPKKDEP